VSSKYVGSEAADKASDYFNSLPQEERAKLAPLLEHYRQMGMAEALDHLDLAAGRITSLIRKIKDGS
jgi:hypothetical protein